MFVGRDSAPPQARRPRLAWGMALVGLLGGLCGCSGWINRNPDYYYDGKGGGPASWLSGMGMASERESYSSLPSHSPIAERRGPFGARKRRAAAEQEALAQHSNAPQSTRNPGAGRSYPYPGDSSAPYPNDRAALAQADARSRARVGADGSIPAPTPAPFSSAPAATKTPSPSTSASASTSAPLPEPAPSWPWPSESAPGGSAVGDPDVATVAAPSGSGSTSPRSPETEFAPAPSPLASATPSLMPPPTDIVPSPGGAPPDSGSRAKGEESGETAKPGAPSKAQVLADAALEKLASVRNYQLTMVRRERVGGSLLPEESLIFSMRREPKSIRMEWTSGTNEGREVIYVPQKYNGKLQVRATKSGLLPTMSISLDNPMIKRSSRHPISEAGLEGVASRVANAVRRAAKGDPVVGKLTYEGPVSIDDGLSETFGQIVKQVMPNGETWLVVFDDQHGLPILAEGKNANGDLIERYQFRDIRFDLPELDSDDAFNPEKRWGRGGLFRRLAGGRSDDEPMPPSANRPQSPDKDETVKPASTEPGSDRPEPPPRKP